jgi:hypothetical protein
MDRPTKALNELTDAELMTYEIPEIGEPIYRIYTIILRVLADRDYRQSVLDQNRVTTEMRQWHEEKLSVSTRQ